MMSKVLLKSIGLLLPGVGAAVGVCIKIGRNRFCIVSFLKVDIKLQKIRKRALNINLNPWISARFYKIGLHKESSTIKVLLFNLTNQGYLRC